MLAHRCALAALLSLSLGAATAGAQAPANSPEVPTATAPPPGVARAVLFSSENCPHCGDVIYRVLPDVQAIFGPQLEVLQFKTQDPFGDILYQMAYELFMPPDSGREVPLMVIGDRALLGTSPIRDEFPLLVQMYLGQGGVDWPAIPGLREALAGAQPAAPTSEPTPTDTVEPTEAPPTPVPPTATALPTATPVPGLADRALGNSLFLGLVLLLALVALGALLVVVRGGGRRRS